LNIPTIDWQGYAEIELTDLGPKVTFYSQIPFPSSIKGVASDGRGILYIPAVETFELVRSIVDVAIQRISLRGKFLTISHEGKELEFVKIYWQEGKYEAYCLFETKLLLLQLSPELLQGYFKNQKAAQEAAKNTEE
jgi:hypothetical protein